ncbi:MAG TPA: succinate dehydrogenase, partial [Sphingobacteriaceae bacterium]|nr:succinate dehydrogenase [Sphingobacteriaceae bacterium]
PVGYAVYNGKANSPWTSRNMGILGTILLIFIVIHMNNFWAQYHWGDFPYAKYEISLTDPHDVTVTPIPFTGEKIENAEYVDSDKHVKVLIARDLYKIVAESFKQWWYVALYVFAMAALAFHLVHGFRSAFQTLGWDHKKYVPLIRFIGEWIFGLLIPILFAAMPLYFFFFK